MKRAHRRVVVGLVLVSVAACSAAWYHVESAPVAEWTNHPLTRAQKQRQLQLLDPIWLGTTEIEEGDSAAPFSELFSLADASCTVIDHHRFADYLTGTEVLSSPDEAWRLSGAKGYLFNFGNEPETQGETLFFVAKGNITVFRQFTKCW